MYKKGGVNSPPLLFIENIGGLKNQSAKMRFSGVNFNVAENFIETTYVDEQGKPRKEYLITEEGAMLLIMGFTGEKCRTWSD